jgi:hypothetical protein
MDDQHLIDRIDPSAGTLVLPRASVKYSNRKERKELESAENETSLRPLCPLQ